MWFGDTYMRMNKRDNYLIKIMAKLIWSDRSALLSDPTASGKSFLLAPSVSGVRSMGLIHSLTFGWNFADVTLADDDTNSIVASWYGVEILNED